MGHEKGMRGGFRERNNIETDSMWGLRVREESKVRIARRIVL